MIYFAMGDGEKEDSDHLQSTCYVLYTSCLILPKLEVHIITPVLQIRRLRLNGSKWLAQVTPTSQDLNQRTPNIRPYDCAVLPFPFTSPAEGRELV